MKWVVIDDSGGGNTEAMEAGGGVLVRFCKCWGSGYERRTFTASGSMTFIPNSHIVGEEQPNIMERS